MLLIADQIFRHELTSLIEQGKSVSFTYKRIKNVNLNRLSRAGKSRISGVFFKSALSI